MITDSHKVTRYFKLAPDCYLIAGKKDAALYDVHRSRIMLLDKRAHKILRRCEDNVPLGEWLGNSGMHLLLTLQDEGLGSFDSAPAYVEKLLLHSPAQWKGFCIQPPSYSRVDWCITNHCDFNCEFCGSRGETLSWQSCQTCLRRNKTTEVLLVYNNPEELVAQIASLGVKILNIRGGNPLLALDRLQRILRAAQSYPELGVVITTPVTGRTLDPLLPLFRETVVQLNIIVFGLDDKVTKAVCGGTNVWQQQLAIIDALVEAEHPPFLTFLLSPLTRRKRSEYQNYVKYRWGIEPSFAEVYPRRDIEEGVRFSHVGKKTKPLSPWQSMDEFFSRIQSYSCTYGNFEIGLDSKIRPCAGLDQVCGEIVDDSLRVALSSHELYDIWEMGKTKVYPCNHCALRFACQDCIAVEFAGSQEPALKQAYCPFDPVNGRQGAHSIKWGPPEFVTSLRVKNG